MPKKWPSQTSTADPDLQRDIDARRAPAAAAQPRIDECLAAVLGRPLRGQFEPTMTSVQARIRGPARHICASKTMTNKERAKE